MVDQNYKDALAQSLLNVILAALENKEIDESELRFVSRAIIAGLKTAQTSADILTFLQNLALKWPIFKESVDTFQSKLKASLEKQTALEALKLMKVGKIFPAQWDPKLGIHVT